MSDAPAPPPEEQDEHGGPAPSGAPADPPPKSGALARWLAPWIARFKGAAADLGQQAKEAPHDISVASKESLRGLGSPDWRTRRMSRVFVASLIGLLVVLVFTGKLLWSRHQYQKELEEKQARIEAEKAAQAEEERKKHAPPTYQSMGFFSLELKEGPVRQKGSLNSAEFEIVLACSSPETCEFVKAHLDLARGELSPLFVPADRERILSVSGKRAFREEIRDTLNRWLERVGQTEGEVVDVLFPRFIAS